MSIRQWVADAINEGGAAIWFLGLLIKGAAEISAALLLGLFLTQIVTWLFPLDAIYAVLGPNTENGIWLFLFLGIAKIYTVCTFTSSFGDSE